MAQCVEVHGFDKRDVSRMKVTVLVIKICQNGFVACRQEAVVLSG